MTLEKNEVPLIYGFYPILDPSYSSNFPPFELAEAILASGVKILQLRWKQLGAQEYAKLAKQIYYLKVHNDFKLVINNFVDVAVALEADGVHLTADSPSVESIRKKMGARCLIGVSVHSIEEGIRRAAEGADYLTFGSVFPSSSKSTDHIVQGIEKLKELVALVSVPVVAIGGIAIESIPKIASTGAQAFSALSELYKTPNPKKWIEQSMLVWKNSKQ